MYGFEPGMNGIVDLLLIGKMGYLHQLSHKLSRIGLENSRWRGYVITGLLVIFLLSSYAAVTQKPHADAFSGPTGVESLWYPIERNAFRRLPVIGADINDIHVHHDKKRLWAVGEGGLILHSHDGGFCWEPQAFPGGSVIPDESRDRCRKRWWPGLPSLIPNAMAVEEKYQTYENSNAINVLRKAKKRIDQITKESAIPNDTIQVEVPKTITTPTKSSATKKQPIINKIVIEGETPSETTPTNARQQIRPTIPNLRSVFFLNDKRGWVVGENGMILTTVDGGSTWQAQKSGVTTDLTTVHFANERRGWTVGRGSTILATSDGGGTWQAQIVSTQAALFDVQLLDSQRGWAVGERGIILATNDGAASWQTQNSETDADLFSVHFVDDQTGWAVGQ